MSISRYPALPICLLLKGDRDYVEPIVEEVIRDYDLLENPIGQNINLILVAWPLDVMLSQGQQIEALCCKEGIIAARVIRLRRVIFICPLAWEIGRLEDYERYFKQGVLPNLFHWEKEEQHKQLCKIETDIRQEFDLYTSVARPRLKEKEPVMTNFAQVQAVRIICNAALKDKMLKAVLDFGATGYTWWECHGKGRNEILKNPYSGSDRLYIQVWCNIEIADKIIEYCDRDEFQNQGVTAGKDPLLVHARQAHKFTKKG